MRDQPSGGHIFNMDGAGADGGATPRFAAYGASKRGLAQLGKSLQVCLFTTAVLFCMQCWQCFKADSPLSQPRSITDTDHVILLCVTLSSTETTEHMHSMCPTCALHVPCMCPVRPCHKCLRILMECLTWLAAYAVLKHTGTIILRAPMFASPAWNSPQQSSLHNALCFAAG